MADKISKTDATPEATSTKKGGAVGFAMIALAALTGSFGVSYATSTPIADSPETCKAEPKDDADKTQTVKRDLVYVPLPDILTTIGSEPATRYLKMTVTLATNKNGEQIAKERKLIIMDAFISYLRSVELSDFEDPSFYGHMREQLSHRSEIILGAETSEGVLITEFLIR